MKKIKTILSILILSLFQVLYSQNTKLIIEKLNTLEENSANTENAKLLLLNNMNFASVKIINDYKESSIFQFSGDNNAVTLIELTENTKNNTQFSKVYTGDFKKTGHLISIRADQLDGKKIGYPLTLVLRLKKEDGLWKLIDITSKKTWSEASIVNKAN